MEVLVLDISQNTKIVVITIWKTYGGLVSGDAFEAEQYVHVSFFFQREVCLFFEAVRKLVVTCSESEFR